MVNKPARRPDGTLLPGNSANHKGGRPKGIEKMIRELVDRQMEVWDGRTLDGWEAMTMMMYEVAMGRAPFGMADADIKMKDRQAAAQFLFDRAHGKARITIEQDTTLHAGTQIANVDVESLDPEELAALEAHVEVLHAKANRKAGPGKVIDLLDDPTAQDELEVPADPPLDPEP